MATYKPLINVPLQYVDPVTGDPMSGGTIEFYLDGTSTATNLFSDDSGTSIGTSITLNSGGFPESGGVVINLFRDADIAYKIILKNAAGVEKDTFDNIVAEPVFSAADSAKLARIEPGADVTDLANVKPLVVGKQSIWFPVDALSPAISASRGCAAAQSVETTAGRPDMRVMDFDSATQEYAQWNYAFPNRWNRGTVTFRAYWTTAAGRTAGLDGVVWGLQAVAVSADDTIDVAYGTEVVVGVDAAQTEEDIWMTAESAAVTIAGTPAKQDVVFFQISRVVGSTSPLDDMDIDARLIGVKVFWTSDALNDA